MVADLSATWATAGPEAPMRWYVCLIAKRHVVEPYQLPPDERAAFWDDAMHAAQRLADAFEPMKMNYEIHGNTIPHLHLHLLPRTLDDPFSGGPIRAGVSVRRSDADLERIRAALGS